MGRVEGFDQNTGQPANGTYPSPSPSPYQAQANGTYPPAAPSPYQPQVGNQYRAQIGDPWSTGLFDCQLDQTNAIMTTVFPCLTFGQIAEVLDEGETTCATGSFIYMLLTPALCSNWIFGSKYRTKLRKKYNLVEAPYEDVISHVFCPCCSLSQEYRELKIRGLDPALGWNGILAQQSRMQNPPQHQTMSM
ncbi:Protein PLANT CADMIUM RESISTANCE 8 [Heracleum sosnowskyi]|uniref:Protein PLANT CADMIUM RESISTANCE 8 n=1 Tax=Heracleum sosnowskyi TaxID=360622 RepID=A0AAD8I123_9APIA|nr:Protein PLANT CADMIUM RESISTANCE 8 [Heracleum sosnowskyi]